MVGMTEQEIIARFYEDIKTTHNVDWYRKLLELPKRSTYGEFFAVLPEPLGSYAVNETRQKFDKPTTLSCVFDGGFLWSETKHGNVWRRLHAFVNRDYGDKVVPTVEELLDGK